MPTTQSCPAWRSQLQHVQTAYQEYAALVERVCIDGAPAVAAAEAGRLELKALLEELKTDINTYCQWWAPEHVPFIESKRDYQQVEQSGIERILFNTPVAMFPDGRLIMGERRNSIKIISSDYRTRTSFSAYAGSLCSLQALPNDRVSIVSLERVPDGGGHMFHQYVLDLKADSGRGRVVEHYDGMGLIMAAYETPDRDLVVHRERSVNIFDPATPEAATLFDRREHYYEHRHDQLASEHYLPSGEILLHTRAARGASIEVIDPAQRLKVDGYWLDVEPRIIFPVSKDKIYGLCLSSVGLHVLEVRIFTPSIDGVTSSSLGCIQVDQSSTSFQEINQFTVLPDGRLLLAYGRMKGDKVAGLWSLHSDQKTWTQELLEPRIPGNGKQNVYAAQVLPDGRIIITSTDGITVWDGDPV